MKERKTTTKDSRGWVLNHIVQGQNGQIYHLNVLEAGRDPGTELRKVIKFMDAGPVPGIVEMETLKNQVAGLIPDKDYHIKIRK